MYVYVCVYVYTHIYIKIIWGSSPSGKTLETWGESVLRLRSILKQFLDGVSVNEADAMFSLALMLEENPFKKQSDFHLRFYMFYDTNVSYPLVN